jgi:hypothetical protein
VPSGVASASAQRLTAIQDPKDFVECLTQLNHRLTRGNIGKPISWSKRGSHGDHALAQRDTLRVAKLRCPGAIRQESSAGALVDELIKDSLE